MSAQEELGKVAREMRDWWHAANHIEMDLDSLLEMIMRVEAIAAIREGLGKAQGEVVAVVRDGYRLEWAPPRYGCGVPPNTPLYAAPPSESAQVLVDALEKIARAPQTCGNCTTRRDDDKFPCHSCRTGNDRPALEDHWRPREHIQIASAALATHKSEVKG